ncbi:MAG: hypothetical protein ACRDMV_04185 [Streptosporangiales bacterium]
MRRILPAVGLFFLSPLVAEFLLGDIPITGLFALVLVGPMYGGGALLIREVCRRAGWGWPSMLALAAAYGVLEEGVATQSLFNPHYYGIHGLLDPAHIPGLDIGGQWTVFVLTLHTVWSISVPIALSELATRERRNTPWLGKVGLAVTAALFVLGVSVNAVMSIAQDPFVASPIQFAAASIVVVGLVAVAVFIGRTHARPRGTGVVPSAWLLGLIALAVTSAFEFNDVLPPWVYVALVLAAYAVAIAFVHHQSRQQTWTPMHEYALAAGALLTYAWHAFTAPTLFPASHAAVIASHIVFGLGAVILLVLIARRVHNTAQVAGPVATASRSAV